MEMEGKAIGEIEVLLKFIFQNVILELVIVLIKWL